MSRTTEAVGMFGAEKVSYYQVKFVLFLSFLAVPVTYLFDNAFQLLEESERTFWMMISGFVLMVVTVVGIKWGSKVHGWLFYGVALFAFTAMIDNIITLEFNGFISNFMSVYLEIGEPYLLSSYGSAIALFDGIGFYCMYLLLAHQLSNGIPWRSTALYWGGGILNSMIVLITGVFTGRHSPTLCTFLNVLYVIFPICVLFRAFSKESRPQWAEKIKRTFGIALFDVVLAAGIIASLSVAVGKGLACLGSDVFFVRTMLEHEPTLLYNDPAPFNRIQGLMYFFYAIPAQLISLYYLIKAEKPKFLWELTLLHAGVLIQGQFSFIVMSLDPQTPMEFRSDWTDSYFWILNLVLVIVPHLFLFRLSMHKKIKMSYSPRKHQ